MFIKSLATGIIPAVLLLAAAGTALAAPVVVNGSFESANLAGQSKNTFAGNVTGWSGANTGLEFIDTPGSADNGTYLSVYKGFPLTSPDGGNFVEADGLPSYNGAFFQTITGLTAGASYDVNFYQAAGQQAGFTGPTTERWQVSLTAPNGATQTDLSPQFSLAQGGFGPWQAVSLAFTATATSEVLSFLAIGTPNGAPPISFLDGVSITSVPEPASVLTLLVGAAGLAAFRLRGRGTKVQTA